MVVIPGIESDLLAPVGLHHRAHNVKRPVAVERSDLDRRGVLDRSELAPELIGQYPPPDRRLQVKAHQRNHLGNGSRMSRQRLRIRAGKRRKTEQPEVVPEIGGKLRLANGLTGLPADARDANDRRLLHAVLECVDGFGRKLENRLEKSDERVADGELRGMHADCQSARAGSQVIARQRPLAALVELAPGV